MAALNEKPTLHEIAAMPYPASEIAMRKHYDPLWGLTEKSGDVRKFKVEFSYSYTVRDFWSCEVEAANEKDAEKIADAQFDKERPYECDPYEVEVDSVTVEERGQ